MYSVFLFSHCPTMDHPYQKAITKLRISVSIQDYFPFLLAHIRCNSCKCINLFTGFFQRVAYTTFECKLIVNNNTQKFFLQTVFNFNTIDINFNVIRGYSSRSFFLINKKVAFFWVSFYSAIFKPCQHITRTFFQPFNIFTRCVFRGTWCIAILIISNISVISK